MFALIHSETSNINVHLMQYCLTHSAIAIYSWNAQFTGILADTVLQAVTEWSVSNLLVSLFAK